MHVDTGHNFDEVIEFRDRTVERLGVRLVVTSVQDDIDAGRVVEDISPRASRNRLQTVTLLRGITENGFGAVFGGARRDEEKARTKERVFSFRDEFGQWDPRDQRPELWSLYNGRHRKGENIRVFPLSNWTELDIWSYVLREQIDLPPLYFAHQRQVIARDGMLLADTRFLRRLPGERRGISDQPASQGRSRPEERSESGDERPREEQWAQLMSAQLLRLATAGSVDDGKSTLIGRLLFDSQAIFEDQLSSVARTSHDRGQGAPDLSLLTDGLRANTATSASVPPTAPRTSAGWPRSPSFWPTPAWSRSSPSSRRTAPTGTPPAPPTRLPGCLSARSSSTPRSRSASGATRRACTPRPEPVRSSSSPASSRRTRHRSSRICCFVRTTATSLRKRSGQRGKTLGRAADALANGVLLRLLAKYRPGDAVLSEESADSPARLSADRVWIIDPLDGTREYGMDGRTDWAVHVALWQRGCGITDAAVAQPALDAVNSTIGEFSVRQVSGRLPDRPVVLVSDSRPPEFAGAVAEAIGGEPRPMGSAGAKTMAVVRSEAAAYLHAGGQWEWDSAAPVGVAVAAGLHASRVDGSPLLYNSPHPYLPDLLICRRELAGALLEAIADTR